MSKRHPYIGPSEAQANAEALGRRSAPYTEAHGTSYRLVMDWHNREPEDLREAERMVRRAYADEVPTRVHEGPDHIGPDGTPRMTAQAEGYIFGPPGGDDAGRDAETGQRDLIGYYHAPFRALLASWAGGSEVLQHRAAIVERITIGGLRPVEAAVAEGVPSWCAKVVTEDALRCFLRSLTNVRLHVPREGTAA